MDWLTGWLSSIKGRVGPNVNIQSVRHSLTCSWHFWQIRTEITVGVSTHQFSRTDCLAPCKNMTCGFLETKVLFGTNTPSSLSACLPAQRTKLYRKYRKAISSRVEKLVDILSRCSQDGWGCAEQPGPAAQLALRSSNKLLFCSSIILDH